MARTTATHIMSHPASVPLVMDEMFSPALAAALRDLGHDVIAVAERGELLAMSDKEVFAWATSQGRWLLTDNVKDFRPILLRALQADTATTGILYTSSPVFPRSRKNPGPLIQAVHAWMLSGPPEAPLTEDWLLNPASRCRPGWTAPAFKPLRTPPPRLPISNA